MFCQHTATALSGYFPSAFWSVLVPQTGYESPPVRHAIVALAALLKCLETTPRSPLRIDVQKQRDTQYQFALRQYNEAVFALRYLLSSKGSHHRTALIASVLFMSIEILQGDHVSGYKHIAAGFSMAAEAGRYMKSPRKTRTHHITIDDELVQMFTDLEVQSKLPQFYTGNNSSKGLTSFLSTLPKLHLPSIPSCFATVQAAKASLDAILGYVNFFHSERSQFLYSKTVALNKHLEALNRWKIAFSPLLQKARVLTNAVEGTRPSLEVDTQAYIPHLILASTHVLAVIIVISNAGRCSEMLYDDLTAEFQRIVDYAETIIHAIYSSSILVYISEVGILPSLHVAASKCRVPGLRRKAIELMRKCPVQEGAWEGYGCAKACEWMMGIEESGGGDGDLKYEDVEKWDASSIPEWNRVNLTAMVCTLHERKIWAQCTSVLPVMHGSHQVWKRIFTW